MWPACVSAISALLLLACPAAAQRDTVLTQSAEFEGVLRLFLRDASKLSSDAVIREQASEMTTIRYTTLPTRKVATIEPAMIEPARIHVDEKLTRLYR
ncbi:MAG: hypothetical protein ACK54P_03305, partial [Bacteroidota bacterium]